MSEAIEKTGRASAALSFTGLQPSSTSMARLCPKKMPPASRFAPPTNCEPTFGFERYLGYLNNNQPRFIVPTGKDPLEWFTENRYGVCGTPDDAIALIERLYEKQGTFGAFLHQAHNWADFEATKRSYELYARYVMPHFSRANAPRAASYQWCGDNRTELSAKRNAAAKAMFDKHEAEQRAARELAEASPGIARPVRGREAW